MHVKLNRPYDGTPEGGLPKGPLLRVTGYEQDEKRGLIYLLSDGSKKMPWEVTPFTKEGKPL